jgi:DNA-binding CsgD family transcriptional regulator
MPVFEKNELSERECEILRLVATGASNKEIGLRLSISANTVKVHLRNIFTKVGVTTRTEAALYAVRMGIVEPAVVSPEVVPIALPSPPVNQPDAAQVEGIERPASSIVIKNKRGILALSLVLLVFLLVLGFLVRRSWMNVAEAGQSSAVTYSRWKEHADLPIARQGLAAVAYEDKIYAIGGETDQGVVDAVECYDPTSDRWVDLSPKPVPVADISSAVLGGLIYVPGGRLASGKPTNALEAYDPVQDRWEKRASLPIALSAYALVAYEGRIFLFGGWDGSHYLDSVYEYDPSRDLWTARASMPTGRAFSGAALAAGKIYVIGGYNGKHVLTANEIYVPDRDNNREKPWTQGKPLPQGRYAMGMTSVAEIVHMVGGEGDPGVKLLPLEYFPHKDEWQSFASPVVESWSRLSLVPLETFLYMVGGRSATHPVARNLSYQAIFTVLFPEIQ